MGSAGDSAEALASPIIVTVDVEPSLSTLYVDDDPPRAMARSGDVHVITVEARTTRAVVLLGMRPVVVSRRPPRRACVEVRMGGIITPRPFTADFDSTRPRLTALEQNFPFSVSATDVEQFRFVPQATRDEISWRLELDWLVAGKRGTTVIDDHGKPFEMYPPDVLWEGRHESDLNWGCGLFHLPGCPAERLAALSRQGTVSIYRDDTGHGLIDPDGGGAQLDLRRSALAPGISVSPGQRVAYEVREVPAGLEVTNVRPANGEVVPDEPVADEPTTETVQDLLADAPANDPKDAANWPAYEALAPRLHAFVGQAPAGSHEPKPFRELVLRVLDYLNMSEQSELGATIARRVHRVWAGALGGNHRDTLAVANRFAGYLFKLGRYEQAEHLFLNTYERRERALGENDPDTLVSAGNLAMILSLRGVDDRVRRLRADTLRRSRQVLGEDHRDTLMAAEAVGNLHLLDEDYEAARAVFADTVRRAESALGPDDIGTLRPTVRLASALRKLGALAEARDLCADVLSRARRVLGENHPLTRSAAAGAYDS
ncbi:tetratricopeptide repeat protein [Lentzea flava]|uniref:CSD domain-containing protein n=1 Tax=Lentzea flava TaxID=103732 RepID=A0ABQ2UWB0_9PSEU|nr:tetratricopeptide repeat protein [Lentzea flava]MCP2200736.1 Cold shock protein, CspA family [Lentzea flava]GGU55225.1 hypothetical protein GCM10010178_54560 [Lentzea flava]